MPKPALSPAEIEATRSRLLAATMRLIANEGYATFSMRRLGQECGLTAGALYRYFPTKHALLVACWTSALESLRRDLIGIVESVVDPRERLLAMMNAYVAFACQDTDRFRIIFLESDRGELGEFGNNPNLLAPYDLFIDQVKVAVDAGLLTPMPPTVAAQILWASVHGVLTLATSVDPLDFGDVATLADLAARTSLNGLTHQPKSIK